MCQKLHSELLVQADDTIDRSQWRKVSVWNLFLVTEIQKDHNCVWPVSKSGFTLIPFSWMKSEVLKAVLRGSAPTCLLSGSLGSFPQWKTQWRTSATVDWGQRETERERRKIFSVRSLLLTCFPTDAWRNYVCFYLMNLWARCSTK